MMSVRRIMENARQLGLRGASLQEYVTNNKESLGVSISRNDFLIALKKVGKSVGECDLKKYKIWKDEFGSS